MPALCLPGRLEAADCAAAQAWDCCLSRIEPSCNHTCQANAKLEQQHHVTVSADVPVQLQHTCLQKSIKGFKDNIVGAGVEQYERAAEPGGEPVQWGDWGGPGAASAQLACLHPSQPQLPPSHR